MSTHGVGARAQGLLLGSVPRGSNIPKLRNIPQIMVGYDLKNIPILESLGSQIIGGLLHGTILYATLCVHV